MCHLLFKGEQGRGNSPPGKGSTEKWRNTGATANDADRDAFMIYWLLSPHLTSLAIHSVFTVNVSSFTHF